MTLSEIEARLDAVAQMASQTIERAEIRKTLGRYLDLERLLAKVTHRHGGSARCAGAWPVAGAHSIACVSALEAQRRLAEIAARLDPVDDVSSRILKAISDEPPVNLADGGTDSRRLPCRAR